MIGYGNLATMITVPVLTVVAAILIGIQLYGEGYELARNKIRAAIIVTITVIVVAATIAGGFIGSLYVASAAFKSSYNDAMEEGEEDRCFVQDYLTHRIPELEGVDPSKVVFAKGKAVKFEVIEPKHVMITDEMAYHALDDYYAHYGRFDYSKAALDEYDFLRGICSILASSLLALLVVCCIDGPALGLLRLAKRLERRREEKRKRKEEEDALADSAAP